MNLVNVRNCQCSIPASGEILKKVGVQRDEFIQLLQPVCFHYRHPNERVTFYPEIWHRPMEFLLGEFLPIFHEAAEVKRAISKLLGKDLFAEFQLYGSTLHFWQQGVFLNLTTFTSSSNPESMGRQASVTLIQEYIADKLGLRLGHYWDIINHLYTSKASQILNLEVLDHFEGKGDDPYSFEEVQPYAMQAGSEDWDRDLSLFMDLGFEAKGYKTRFFRRVVAPMAFIYKANREGEFEKAREMVKNISATDWRKAVLGCLTHSTDGQHSSEKPPTSDGTIQLPTTGSTL